jgi:hypothetical protein
MSKLNKVNVEVQVEKKVDNRKNNTGRPVNKKSARQIRLAKQAFYKSQHDKFVNGNTFKINTDNDNTYVYNESAVDKLRKNTYGHISGVVGHQCNVDYIGRTKVTGFTYVLGKRVNVTINLKEITF